MISFTKYQSPTAPTLPPGLFTFSSFDGAQGKTNPSSASISSFAGGFFVITLLTVGTSITATCAAAAAAEPPASACTPSAEPTAADFGASGVPRLGPTLKTTSFRCRRSIRRSSLLKNPPDCLPRTLMPPPCVLLCLGLDDLSLPSRNVGPSSSAAASAAAAPSRWSVREILCSTAAREAGLVLFSTSNGGVDVAVDAGDHGWTNERAWETNGDRLAVGCSCALISLLCCCGIASLPTADGGVIARGSPPRLPRRVLPEKFGEMEW